MYVDVQFTSMFGMWCIDRGGLSGTCSCLIVAVPNPTESYAICQRDSNFCYADSRDVSQTSNVAEDIARLRQTSNVAEDNARLHQTSNIAENIARLGQTPKWHDLANLDRLGLQWVPKHLNPRVRTTQLAQLTKVERMDPPVSTLHHRVLKYDAPTKPNPTRR